MVRFIRRLHYSVHCSDYRQIQYSAIRLRGGIFRQIRLDSKKDRDRGQRNYRDKSLYAANCAEQSDKYFTDEDEFVEYYWQNYLDGSGGCNNFDEYFEYEIPKVLWNCEEVKISMDADSIIENACEELHEDARDNISNEKELQDFLNKWCAKQAGTATYYPCYKEYVRVKKEWFD